MFRMLLRLVRLALVAAVVGCVVAPVSAEPRNHAPRLQHRHQAPDVDHDRTTTNDRARNDRPPGDPELGVVWIAVGIALLVFMVWVAVRIGDNDR
jgi:hypothetical protein